MSKYGRGLGLEIVSGVKTGEITEPLTTEKIRSFCELKGWNPSENYLEVFLANTASETHSGNYKKYIERNTRGEYVIATNFRE